MYCLNYTKYTQKNQFTLNFEDANNNVVLILIMLQKIHSKQVNPTAIYTLLLGFFIFNEWNWNWNKN